MIFIGIDLAWSPHNQSGGAVIREQRLITATGTLRNNAEIIAFVTHYLQPAEGAVVAIDAPLRVPNATGARACDRALSADWRAYDAGALPANRRLLTHDGAIRGEVLVAQMERELGFQEAAPLPHRGQGRYLCEIFPHPVHVSLFQLDKTLKYKAKPGRTPAMRQQEFARYQRLLATLSSAEPALQGVEGVLHPELAGLRGRALKAHEDMLDAITCAYTACYLWYHGPAKAKMYGSVADGHILTPSLPESA